MCNPRLDVWGVQLPDDSFMASGVAYDETRRIFVYNDSGFFTFHISRSERTGGHYSWVQICVLRDAEHLRRVIEAVTTDWRP
jgi:hypothetical protein